MRVVLRGLLFFALVLAGCATGGDDGDGAAGDRDGGGQQGRDGGPGDDGGGTVTCGAGQHMCGGGCIDDLENVPENGCRLGCGEPCPTPPDGVASCDESGMCTTGCEPPFHLEGTECVCTPNTCEDIGYMCGAPDNGCGTPLDCGACEGDGTCMAGLCSCTEDEQEPNDSTLAIRDMEVVHIPDENDWQMTFTSWNLHDSEDEDWYRFTVAETGTTNPGITVTLDGISEGSDYELSAYYVCDDGGDISSCTLGSPCSGSASGMSSETINMDIDCDRIGWDDNGVLYVRVTSARWGGSCAPYSLFVRSES